MLFHALSDGAMQAYQVQRVQRLDGALDRALFQRAWAEVVNRHAVLRTAFVWQELRRPLQRVEAAVAVPWVIEDWRSRTEAQQAADLDRYLAEDRRRGFVLTQAPLARGALFHVADDTHWFVWSFHHLLMDGWATSHAFNEVYRIYRAWSAGQQVRLGRARPYRDYIAWLQQQDLQAAERHWRGVLGDFMAPTPLGFDRPAGRGAEMRYAMRSLKLSSEETGRLEEVARRWQVTLHTIVQGAWGILLASYAGEEDVVFGTTVSGRPAELDGVDEMVGLFINTLPVRVRVSGETPLRQWLSALQRAQAAAREYEYTPLVQLQAWSAVPRGTPLFESHVIYENYPVEPGSRDPASGGLRVTGMRGNESGTYPLSVIAAPGEQLLLALSYDERRFEADAIARVLGHLRCVLEQIATGVDMRLFELELLDAAERTRVLDTWNDTQVAYPADRSIHELFEAQSARTPTAVAVVFDDESITYEELNARANQLAQYLVRLGVEPEGRVAICLERSVELVVAFLAVLKAGAVYVPLDPSYPADRLAFMLADSGARVLLTREPLRGAIAADATAHVVDLTAKADEIAAERTTNPTRYVGPHHLAYIIYTSGSTGRPKGAAVPHRAVVRLVQNTDYVSLTSADRVAQASNASFDAVTFDVWGALLNGAVLVGLSREVMLSPARLASEIAAHGITTMFVTTALFNVLARNYPEAFRSLRWLLFGGEAVDPNAVRDLLAAGGPEHLLHVYGPTENTTFSTWHEVGHVPADAHTVPIGRPLANSSARVLDAALNPVPAGVLGELYVGGDGLARGYWRQPSLTAEKFVPDPFSKQPGARLYRTGDRVRWLADGTLEFSGRVDRQLKIRGFRIEPGEVEAALSAHPRVREVRVVAREDRPGDKRLVAYVVGQVEAADLRTSVRDTLPDYMVPAAFVGVDRLPLTPNGKLDVPALPAPTYEFSAEQSVAPRTAMEAALAKIWTEVLRLERVGATDSFFELGGHSIQAMRVLSRIRATFGVELPVRALFESPSVAELSQRVEKALLPRDASPLVPVARTKAMPLSFAQERLWVLDRLQPWSTSLYAVPSVLRLEGALDTAALERALGEIVRRHESLRTTFPEVDGRPLQRIAPFAGFTLPMEDLSELGAAAREAAARRAREEAARPFDLAVGPLFRAALLRASDEDHVLMLCMHHVITDGWSQAVLFRELSALYEAFRDGRTPPLLPDLPVQYVDYAIWQRARLQGEDLARELTYWKQRLTGAPPLSGLPTDKPRPAVQTYRGTSERIEWSVELLEGLQALARREGATLYMVLLCAFDVLLAKYGDTEDVVVGSPIAGRTRKEVENLIGFFVNMLVLRTDLSGDPSFREGLRRVRDVTLGAYEHQEVPFEKLVAELQPDRTLSHAPLFQISFVLQESEGFAPVLSGLQVRGLRTEIAPAKFDLALELTATPHGLVGGLIYSTDLFERHTIQRLIAHLTRVLEQIVANPQVRLSELVLLDAAERSRVLTYSAQKRQQDRQPDGQEQAPRTPRIEGPRDHVEVQLFHIWQELLGVEVPSPHVSFFELGGNSLLSVSLVAQLKRRLQYDLPVATLFAGAGIRRIATAILEQRLQQHSGPAPSLHVVPLQPSGSLPILFCVHPTSRWTNGYFNLARHLGRDQPVFGIQDVGEDLSRPIHQIAAEHVQAIRSVQSEGPYHLLGWSFGGMVAYEMASQLQQAGELVAFVGVLDTPEPGLAARLPRQSDAELVVARSIEIAVRMGRPFSLRVEDLEPLALDEQFCYAAGALHAQGAAPPYLDASTLRQDWETGRARIESVERYAPSRFSGPLTLVRASENMSRLLERALASHTDEEKRTLGWCALAQGPVDVHWMPGSHTTIGMEPHVSVLAKHLRELLAAARRRTDAHAHARKTLYESV
jgi:amino acid adenylation domain-containing protein